MNDDAVGPPTRPWLRSRYGFAAFWFCSLLIAWLVLRLVFFFAFAPSGLPPAQAVSAFLHGFHRDVFMGLVFTIPLLFWFMIVPESQFAARWHRVVMLGAVFISCYVQIF